MAAGWASTLDLLGRTAHDSTFPRPPVRVWYAAGMEKGEKARENRARRALERRGYRMAKSRRRDPHAIGYGEYVITNARGQAPRTRVVLSSIDEVEQWLVSSQADQ
jgi:hypothetical protein